MKCPKCAYLGFETGHRCRNCGYDFSLMMPPSAPLPDVNAGLRADRQSPAPVWLDAIDEALGKPLPAAPPDSAGRLERGKAAPALPLFRPAGEDDDDEPLVKLPAAPRVPLSVRKTPDTPRLRAMSRPSPPVEAEPVLQFADETVPLVDLPLRDAAAAAPARVTAVRLPARDAHGAPGGTGARLGAAVIDHLILFAIDAAVVYFTLRMAALPPSDWHVLPAAPLFGFLVLLKFAYFCAFTAVGGQTIGKMALGIRVVTDDNLAVGGARAVRRTIAGVAACALGLGFVPALFGPERRAFHDRIARTRVVALRSV
jgi:uncharacterized RDD family membrane protein YckC